MSIVLDSFIAELIKISEFPPKKKEEGKKPFPPKKDGDKKPFPPKKEEGEKSSPPKKDDKKEEGKKPFPPKGEEKEEAPPQQGQQEGAVPPQQQAGQPAVVPPQQNPAQPGVVPPQPGQQQPEMIPPTQGVMQQNPTQQMLEQAEEINPVDQAKALVDMALRTCNEAATPYSQQQVCMFLQQALEILGGGQQGEEAGQKVACLRDLARRASSIALRNS